MVDEAMADALALKEGWQRRLVEVVQHAGGEEDVAWLGEREGVGHLELADQVLLVGPGPRRLDERRVHVAADELDVAPQPTVRRERAHHEARAAADVDHPERRRHARVAQRLQHGQQEAPHPVRLQELFVEALEFGVGAQQHRIAEVGVEHAVDRRQAPHVAGRAALSQGLESPSRGLPLDRPPRERGQVIVDDDVGEFEQLARHGGP